ncbi:hypothetical protein HYT56_03560 [Candidatus Woesearchaeota archaeon]|nr:hypothetical protein [Candidatus Woesearchaeota archaeon]
MPRVKETGKYIYRIAEAELKKKASMPDLVLIPDKKYKKRNVMKLKFVKYNPKTKSITFKVTKRDHKF